MQIAVESSMYSHSIQRRVGLSSNQQFFFKLFMPVVHNNCLNILMIFLMKAVVRVSWFDPPLTAKSVCTAYRVLYCGS